MKHILHMLIIFVLIFSLTGALVMAQDDTLLDEDVPLLEEAGGFGFEIAATSYENRIQVFAEMFFRLIYNLVYLPIAAPLVHILVQLTKRFASDTISAPLLNFIFTVAMFAIWIAANEIGYGGQFESVLAGLTTIGAGVLGVTLSTSASSQLFNFSKGQKLPVLGYSRTA